MLSLLEAVAEPPATAEQATSWVDKRGTLLHPGMQQLQSAIDSHLAFVARIAAANGARNQQQGAVMSEALGQGLASEGIDMQRMQRDPAYAQSVQERIRRMSPAEQMAFAQRMSQPLNSDRRFVNQAQAMVEDAPAMRAAASAGEAYVRAQPQRLAQASAIWAEAEKEVERIRARRLVAGVPKPATEWDNIGCDKACRGQWDAYAAKMLPLMIARDTEILAVRRAALQRQRAAVLAELKSADQHLSASAYGAASRSDVNQSAIVAYDQAAIAEIVALRERTIDAVKSAAIVAHCGKQLVLVPLAACS
ncbi:hypothetical protein [Roseateles violae]|uniref:Uncharacterized protein n=1 Tax=Roseateles violae TaxID=3058042 RepID=A0ABT8DQQ5_9BURK|nr:hypothetical protein [Pelomonas sp. PFR6]MDN3920346.1 hypothetical protein [Pelomonas sp. PFR6]